MLPTHRPGSRRTDDRDQSAHRFDGCLLLSLIPCEVTLPSNGFQDQTKSLKRRGIMADTLDSTKSRSEYLVIQEQLKSGKLKILFVAPERLLNECKVPFQSSFSFCSLTTAFMALLSNIRSGISLIAIDEAHCVSEVYCFLKTRIHY